MIIVLCKLGRSFSGEPNLKGYIFCARGSTFNNLRDNSNSHSNLITDVHPKGGGGFQDSGRKWTWGEGGFLENGCPLRDFILREKEFKSTWKFCLNSTLTLKFF